jgi:hypothetical protein
VYRPVVCSPPWRPDRDEILCIEYTWRRSEFLGTNNRAGVAEYVLKKLKNYAVALRWVEP